MIITIIMLYCRFKNWPDLPIFVRVRRVRVTVMCQVYWSRGTFFSKG